MDSIVFISHGFIAACCAMQTENMTFQCTKTRQRTPIAFVRRAL
jgi:hypothetical protein